jgi:flagellar biosynthesis protein FlhF
VKIKRYFAKDMRTALAQVKEELGVDAVIMSNKKSANGVEIVAAVDNATVATAAQSTAQAIAESPKQALSAYSNLDDSNEQGAKVASSLQELLSRQTASSESQSDNHASKSSTLETLTNQKKIRVSDSSIIATGRV